MSNKFELWPCNICIAQKPECDTDKQHFPCLVEWQLTRVDDIDWTRDKSGIYVLINWDVARSKVRLDIVAENHLPIVSFLGSSDNVRKAVGRWVDSRVCQQHTSYRVSAEHAAYIGSELEKADTMRIDYIQDGPKVVPSDNPFDVPASVLLRNYAKENKQKADNILAEYETQPPKFMVLCDVDRWNVFTKEIETANALACSSRYYLHECPDTACVFLCEAGFNNNIVEVLNVKKFHEYLDRVR